jgi:Fe-S cluster assembly protein SufD
MLSHGCTIGQLDETAMFYMQQRGIKKEAKALLMYAFSNAVIKHQNTRIKTTNHQNYRY